MRLHLLAAAVAFLLASSVAGRALAETKPTGGGSLDILLEPSADGSQTKFKVTFLQPGKTAAQNHVDYDFVISDSASKELFRAAKQLNQPVLHTEPGIVTIPYKFEKRGTYEITVEVYGILFVPINPEEAKFTFNSGQPAGAKQVSLVVTASTNTATTISVSNPASDDKTPIAKFTVKAPFDVKSFKAPKDWSGKKDGKVVTFVAKKPLDAGKKVKFTLTGKQAIRSFEWSAQDPSGTVVASGSVTAKAG